MFPKGMASAIPLFIRPYEDLSIRDVGDDAYIVPRADVGIRPYSICKK